MLLRTAKVVILLSFPVLLNAGDPPYTRFGAGEAGMGYACVASTGSWCSFHNQAAMPYSNTFSLGTSYESRFMMSALSAKTLCCIIPGRPAPLGIIMTHYGNSQYALISGGLGSAVILAEGLSLGAQVDIFVEHSAGSYRDYTYVTFEAGMQGRVSPHVTVGFHLFNPLAHLNRLPSAVRAGVAWQPDASLTGAVEISKMSGTPLSVHTGIAWHLPHTLILRVGYYTCPSSFTFSTGVLCKGICIDAGCAVNTATGITPLISLLWKPRAK